MYLSYYIYFLLCYIISILTPFFARFVAPFTTWSRNSGSTGHKYFIQNRTRNPINSGCKFYYWLFNWGVQEYIFQISGGSLWLNECDSFSNYIVKGCLPHLSYIFYKSRTTGGIFKYYVLLCYCILSIHIETLMELSY